MEFDGICTNALGVTIAVCGEQAHCDEQDVDVPYLCKECPNYVASGLSVAWIDGQLRWVWNPQKKAKEIAECVILMP